MVFHNNCNIVENGIKHHNPLSITEKKYRLDFLQHQKMICAQYQTMQTTGRFRWPYYTEGVVSLLKCIIAVYANLPKNRISSTIIIFSCMYSWEFQDFKIKIKHLLLTTSNWLLPCICFSLQLYELHTSTHHQGPTFSFKFFHFFIFLYFQLFLVYLEKWLCKIHLDF